MLFDVEEFVTSYQITHCEEKYCVIDIKYRQLFMMTVANPDSLDEFMGVVSDELRSRNAATKC
jgi:hypothetical protein